MNFEKRLVVCACACACLLPVSAEDGEGFVRSTNIHAMVKVFSCATNTIISVPWMFYTPDDNPVCTMLANPDCLHETDVNSLGWSGVGSTDTLIITTDAKTTLYCTYRKNGGDKARWGYSTQTRVNKGTAEKPYWVVQTRRVDAPKVPAGTGFWYVRRTNADMVLTWPAPKEGTSPTTGE